MFHSVLSCAPALFHLTGYSLLVWLHQGEPTAQLAYALVLASIVLGLGEQRLSPERKECEAYYRP